MRTRLDGKLLLLLLSFAAVMLIFPAMAYTQEATNSTADPAGTSTEEPAPADTGASTEPASTAPPTVRSDQDDYPPGALVTLTGANWQPGETVNIYVEDDQGKTWSRTVDVTADADGNIIDRFNLPDWFVATYTVRATGTQSGVAMTRFTDGNIRFFTTNSETNFNGSWTKHTKDNCNSAGGSAPTSGSGLVRHSGGNTLAAGANSGEWIRITAPAEIGNYAFSSWSGPSGFSSANATLCAPGFAAGGNADYTANYVPRQTTTATPTVLTVAAATGTYGGSVNLSATLTANTAGGSAVPNKPVSFSLRGNAVCGGATGVACPTTNASGVATLNNVNLGNTDAGTYATGVGASFAGDSTHAASNGNNSLTVNKANQTITFAALADRTFGDNFRVSATASSGLPVSFESLTTSACTVTGDTVQTTAAGACTIRASQGGNTNYNPAPVVDRTFTINRANQAITFEAPTGKTFGDADFDPGATASSGLTVSYRAPDPANNACTIDSQTNRVRIASAGTCTVTASQAGNANYNAAADVTRSFPIAKASQTIRFAADTPTTKTVDDPDFQVSATGGASNNPVTFGTSSPSTTCTVSDNGTVRVVGAGTCTVTASQVGNTNYEAATANHAIAIGKANQRTLTVTSPTSGTYGDRLEMSASGGSGTGALSFAATGTACEIPTSGADAGKLVITSGTGTCSITATKAGDANYQSATSAPQQVAISKAQLSVNAKNQTTRYGDENLPAAYELSGFVNNQTPASAGITGNPVCSISTSAGPDVGEYLDAVTCAPGTLSAANYSFAAGSKGKLTITARPITVTAEDKSKTYGEADPTLTYNVTSGNLVQGDAFTGALGREAGQDAGSYAIRQGTLSAGENYELTFVPGTLRITARTIEITAEDKTKTYGDADPDLTYNVTSGELAQGDSLNGSLEREEGQDVGSYAIRQGTLSASNNYELAFVPGTLTVTKRAIEVTAEDKTKTYGDADPELTYSVTSQLGLVDGDSFQGSLEREAGQDVGSYAIQRGTLSAGNNYELTFVPGTLRITARAIEVTADDKSKTYGEDDPEFTYNVTNGNLVQGDAFTGALGREAGQDAGSYAIRQGTLSAGENYELTFVPGTLTINKAALTVTANDKSKTYGEANPQLTASYNGFVNGDGPASLGGELAFDTTADAGSAVGTYAITPSGLTSNNYEITFRDGTLRVTPATLTVTADDKTKTYGETNPELTGTLTGVKNNDGITASYGTDAAQGSSVGTYAIVPSLNDPNNRLTNYDVTRNNGTLTVTRAPLTVTADDKQKTYGDALTGADFSGEIVGIKNNDAITASYSSNGAAATSGVGTYSIVPQVEATDAVLANYQRPQLNNGTLTVNKAPLTVTADDKTKTYGEANPDFTVSYGGFVNGDDKDDLGGALAYSTNADAASPVGTYDVTPKGLTSGSYEITFRNGTLTVNKAPLTVTADDKEKVYGEANPTLTGNIEGIKNNDNISASYSTAATAASKVGTYAIEPSVSADPANKLDNYDVTRNNGTLTVTKATLTVTADDKTKTYGDANPDLTASYSGFKNGETLATSGVTGSPSLTTNADQQSSVGDYAITAAQGTLESGNYSFDLNNGTLTVNQATLTVTADDKSKTYGDGNPQFTASYSGWKNNDTVRSLGGTLAFSTQANQQSGVGTYAITPSGLTSNNYEITFRDGTLRVTPATLTVTADDKTKTYGETNPDFTVSYDGFKNNDTANSLGGQLQYSTQATQSSPVGTYDVTPKGLTSDNYTITFRDGTLTVNKAPLTVTAKDATKTYGDANPAFEVEYSGFANGDGKDDLGGTLTFETQADRSSPVGSYDVTPSGLTSGNYDISFVKGTLTVTKASLTVTAEDKSKVYGADLPAFSVSYDGFKGSDGPASLGGTLAFDSQATKGSPVGTYAITPSGLTSDNYNISFVKGALTVTRAPLTVTADDKTKTYGDANPDFTVSYGGLTNGDAAADLNGELQFGTQADRSSPVGSYDVTPSGLTSGNYDISFVKGTLTVTKRPIAVTAEDKTKTYGEADPTLTHKVTSGNLVNGDTFSGNVQRDSGQTVGAYAIRQGTLSLSGNYNLTFNNGTLTIGKAPLTVTADNKAKTYGDANPTFTVSYSGFVNGDDKDDLGGALAYSTNADAASPVGTYAVTPKGLTSDNYDIAFRDGTLTVNKADLTVTADDKSKTYGAANPALTGTLTGVKNNDGITASYSTTATQQSPVGTYAIEPAALNDPNDKLSNYNVAKNNGTLTVDKAVLTVTADDKTKTYGEANPDFTVSYDGFVNGDDKDDLGGTLAFDTTAAVASPVGTYDVTPKGLTSKNYNITFVKATLTVEKATLTVAADNKTKTYGETNPALTASYSGWKNNDSAATALSGSPALSTNATQGSNAGDYTITAGQGTLSAKNYTFTFKDGTLTVTKATLTVAADNKTKFLNAANPTFTSSYSGFKNGETLATSGVTGTPALSTGATQQSPVGSYTITAAVGTLDAKNYSFTFQPGTLKIIYNWDGFRSPVDNPGTGATPVFNSAKAGQSIPMKFSLSGNQGLGVIAAGYPKVTSVNCISSASVDPLEEYAASTANGGLNYDSSIDQYNYVWKTQSTYATKCYKFDMQLLDGTSHVAYFKFTK